ncbi:MATE family efflux transporter [Paenibacillus wynnii]|uniref:MATE family efflux transporter n=1 Tax=Paenibacillus wynnii TaxID=268407 RepID=UPI002791F1AC|nr:MATE family efflux transporter [Paenibacillus wynnii]MDQ0192498.1 Na+-driven multidrug efflux pump [Paenibacillus wynnii]
MFVSLVYVFRETIIRLFSDDPSVWSVGTTVIGAMLISALFNGFTGLFISIIQATGQGTPTAIMSITQGVLYIPVIITLHFFFGLDGVIWSMTVTEVTTSLMGVILFIIFNKKLKEGNQEDTLEGSIASTSV